MSQPQIQGNETFLFVERALEGSPTSLDNLNIIEHLLVRVIERISAEDHLLSANFILRRLPTYLGPFANTNEYGVLLNNLGFTLRPRDGRKSAEGPAHFGQTEIYFKGPESGTPPRSFEGLLTERQAYRSLEIFKRFAGAFAEVFEDAKCQKAIGESRGRVQMLGSHLIPDVKFNPEVRKMFKLSQSEVPVNKSRLRACGMKIEEGRAYISVSLEGTEVKIRPCVYSERGSSRITGNLLERVPLFHPGVLDIAESLAKGYLLTPTGFDTLWALQTWPSESHLISIYQPRSAPARVLKLFAGFALNPAGIYDIFKALPETALKEIREGSLPMDFVVSAFLHEIERIPRIEEWRPLLLSQRLCTLIASTLDSYEKGFHAHYFTKGNLLRGIWRARRQDDDLEGLPEGLFESESQVISAVEFENEDEFNGFEFENLESLRKRVAAGTRNPFEGFDPSPQSQGSKVVKSRSIGASFLSKIGGSLPGRRRRSSNASLSVTISSITRRRSDFDTDQWPSELQGTSNGITEQNGASGSQILAIYHEILTFFKENQIPENEIDLLDLEKEERVLESQSELIAVWTRVMAETSHIKFICPHSFSPRQLQYIALIIAKICKCSPLLLSEVRFGSGHGPRDPVPSWEMSGDILRLVLYQMRSNMTFPGEKVKGIGRRRTQSFSTSDLKSKLSFRITGGGTDECKRHLTPEEEVDPAFQMEPAELAASRRLLEWLWQLRNSGVGRLSSKARAYLEELHRISRVNCHFLDQIRDQDNFRVEASRCAAAVSRIMMDERFPANIPLLSASRKGWLWAEMILSLAAWNREKGYSIKAEVPLGGGTDLDEEGTLSLLREIGSTQDLTLTRLRKDPLINSEPDTDAVTLAFHSETALPLGWFDFEDPRRPGPFAVPILIYSSIGYFNRWEVVPGNIVQVLLRLQKFNSLQHVGGMLLSPHRKTALNEVRKLNKSLSFRILQFDDNVMSKTFRRLASSRGTKKSQIFRENFTRFKLYKCEDIGCVFNGDSDTTITQFRGREFQCTKL